MISVGVLNDERIIQRKGKTMQKDVSARIMYVKIRERVFFIAVPFFAFCF